jgi:hypothetical protein
MLTDEQYGQQLGEQLRHELDDVTTTPDLMAKLRRRQTRRTWAIGTVIATPVAAAVAVAVVVTTAGQAAPGETPQANGSTPSSDTRAVEVENVSYVQAQTLKALSQAAQYVIEAKSTYDGGHYDTWTDKATNRYRNDVYDSSVPVVGSNDRTMRLPAPGDIKPGPIHLRQSHAVSGPDDDREIVTLDYDRKQWHTGRVTDTRPEGEPDITDADSVRKAIADGTLELVGKEKVDEYDTLHLRLFGPARAFRIDMWVDGKTYLPVQETAAKSSGKKGDQEFPAVATVTTKYKWLPRNEENLARLVLTPPPGFEHVK